MCGTHFETGSFNLYQHLETEIKVCLKNQFQVFSKFLIPEISLNKNANPNFLATISDFLEAVLFCSLCHLTFTALTHS